MKTLLLFASVSTLSLFAYAEKKFPVSEIPDSLKRNSNAVIRRNDIDFTIISRSNATYHVYEAITILNEKGREYAIEVIGYDKLSKVKEFKGSVYDASGALIKKNKASDIIDRASFDGFTLYSDNRIKSLSLIQGTYPYTVEFEYEIEYKYLFFIPRFNAVPDENVAVQHETYTITYPQALAPRYRVLNMDAKPTKLGPQSVSWVFENFKAIKFEPMGPSSLEIIPQILVAPSEFEFEGYQGKMDSWMDLGLWMNSLNKGRGILPEEAMQKINQLTSGLKTREEKAKVLYEYLQNKTRYVGIQLGIGGLQPFEAAVVDQTGYGDCKALSNYMVAILEQAGIKAHYTLIRAGKDEDSMVMDFPSSQFNHAVVFVPNGKDTIWLECTSQTNPFGYMGSFTGDRKALAIIDGGAKIVHTPVYKAEDNVQWRTADVYVDAGGDAMAKVKTRYSGLQYENGNLDATASRQYDDQKKWIQRNTQIPSFDINSFTMTEKRDKIPSVEVDMDLTLRRYGSVSGKRLFFMPNLMNRSTFLPEKVPSRKTKVICSDAFIDQDSINFHVPENLYPEFLPQPVKFQSRFGTYEASITLTAGKLIYIRRVTMRKGEFPPDSYNELIDFYKNMNKADNQKLVFLNKT